MIHERLLTIQLEQFDEQDTGNIIATGPLTCQPGSTASRHIIHTLNGKLVVHRQSWCRVTWKNGKPVLWGKPGLSDGNWFWMDQLQLAIEKWTERIRDTNASIVSCYRPLSTEELNREVPSLQG
jgi:hypothetical protein